MKLIKQCSQNYVNWVLRLGRAKAALLGFFVLAFFAIIVQGALTYLFTGEIQTRDILRSISFGLISAPFVIYFFNLIVVKLEKSRIQLEQSIYDLGVLREQDAHLNATLEKNNRDKSVLMATISHELRTPLNGIIGLSRILLEGELTQQQREYLKTINISAVSLGHIFSDIIDLEKIDSRRIELFNKEVEFSQLISDISNFANLMADQRKIKFHISYSDNLPNFILVDNARLSQVLWNLVSNAVKFTPAGGDIYLDVQRVDDDHFSFSLRDTGIGIPKNEQRKVFAMFYQAENSQEKKAQGSGIGLAISKRIAKLMGGDLTLESEEGKGSTFTLTIQADTVEAKKAVKINDHALKVLLVEDIEVNVVVARAMLEKFGCDVDVAMTGDEAFELFEQNSYDLILLDIQLPDMTGFDIARQLRERYENEEVDYLPLLVALTANIMQTKEEYQQQGMDDVLRKPLSLEALSECLNHYFNSDFVEKTGEIRPLVDTEEALNLPYDRKILSELIEVMGAKAVLANFALFAKLMPEYLENLQHYLTEWQATDSAEMRKNTADEAHKIKGALASVSLKRLQEIAQYAQTDNGEIWEEHIAQWVFQIAQQWQADLALAEHWVKENY
ncbi:ATP-binding protein [Actinobacillus equuli]|uniref:Aerobic respiration control sensor protein n=1 Tax=Actinobacillus equuli subsp. equuli TaxID=202947 RepID=A0A9X4JCI2_ACTEU|nr:ATP-binding protein [Actinobacillus equuli]MDE8034842.1 ATP-binding protein [Actinobacillus equuli subsp. equuli]WGE46987.1 ATP-binding protein [Actinobacillus equuli subsp. haemolyticus]WGE65793.1 ATP-binding protein [Actinobacillus equuli subsp. equuli]WGE79746.1 ATP-binding protein [Actinobacillus equuli subsp. equuli]WGE81760.1 ATP-binding protein [Actinobacillus equuli subsp. haemolyticus]